jgi:hypothetical protein
VQAENSRGGGGLERVRVLQRALHRIECLLDRVRKRIGLGCRCHPASNAHEKGILQIQAQPAQCMAYRRLRQAERLGGAADAARGVDRGECAQQIQIQAIDLHDMHGIDEGSSHYFSAAGPAPITICDIS